MTKPSTRLLILTLSFFFWMGCSMDKNTDYSKPQKSRVQPKIKLHELGMEVKENQLSPNQKKLISQIEEEKPVDRELLSKIVLEIHKDEFLKKRSSLNNFHTDFLAHPSVFDFLLDQMLPETNPHDFKVNYEKRLLDFHNGTPLKYNRDNTSVFSPLLENRMQCYSGTIFFDLIYRRFKKSAYFEENQVFIYEDAHILPGYLSKIDGQWHLFGIETTLSGSAKKIYGPTSGLRGVRVVDSHLAMGIEAFKNHIINKASVLKTALEKTALLYDIPLGQTESSLSNVSISMDGTLGSGTTSSNTGSYLNSSLFSFGDSSQVPSGDQDRETIEEFTAKPGTTGSRILSHPGNWRTLTNQKPSTQLPMRTLPSISHPPVKPLSPQSLSDNAVVDSLFKKTKIENESIYIGFKGSSSFYKVKGHLAVEWKAEFNKHLSSSNNSYQFTDLFEFFHFSVFPYLFDHKLMPNGNSMQKQSCNVTHPDETLLGEMPEGLSYYEELFYVGPKENREIHFHCYNNALEKNYTILRLKQITEGKFIIPAKTISGVLTKPSQADLFIIRTVVYSPLENP